MKITRQDGCESNRMSEIQNENLKTNFEMRILIQDVAKSGKELFAHAENRASAPK